MPDSILVVTVGQEEEDGSFGFLQAEGVSAGVMDALIELAVSIGVEGWEGRPVGALFVVGDSNTVMEKSRQLTLNPFQGYSEDEKNIMNPDVRHALHAFAVLDGAFIVREDGVVVAAGRYLNFDEEKELDVPLGPRARATWRRPASRATPRRSRSSCRRPRARCACSAAARPRSSWRPRDRDDRERAATLAIAGEFAGGPASRYDGRSAYTRPSRSLRWWSRSDRVGAAPARARGRREGAASCSSRGRRYYDLGQFDKAIEAWQQGYDQKPDPGFLYNIAQAYRQKQDAAEGDLLLQGLPAELAQGAQPRRGRAEDRGAAEAAGDAGGTPPPPATRTPPPEQRRRRRPNNDHAAAGRHVDADGDDPTEPPPGPTVIVQPPPPPTSRDTPTTAVAQAAPPATAVSDGRIDVTRRLGPAFWSSGVQRNRQAVVRAARWRAATRSATPMSRLRFRLGGLFGYTFLAANEDASNVTLPLVPARSDARDPAVAVGALVRTVDLGLGPADADRAQAELGAAGRRTRR